ncbi:MAG: MoaD/ThiS family protein [Gemmatimonadota bacterium]|nr:MoaD/ThiS family protein [Gemmatimonadota bacterium]
MARVTLEVPPILRDSADGDSTVELDIDRLDAAREEIRRRWPALATHVFTEEGKLRPHVLLLHNDRLLRNLPAGDVDLADGDRLEIVQAVSGG